MVFTTCSGAEREHVAFFLRFANGSKASSCAAFCGIPCAQRRHIGCHKREQSLCMCICLAPHPEEERERGGSYGVLTFTKKFFFFFEKGYWRILFTGLYFKWELNGFQMCRLRPELHVILHILHSSFIEFSQLNKLEV